MKFEQLLEQETLKPLQIVNESILGDISSKMKSIGKVLSGVGDAASKYKDIYKVMKDQEESQEYWMKRIRNEKDLVKKSALYKEYNKASEEFSKELGKIGADLTKSVSK